MITLPTLVIEDAHKNYQRLRNVFTTNCYKTSEAKFAKGTPF